MSLSEWTSLIDAELGKDAAQFGLTPDMPVFVLAMRGNVEWRLPAGPPRPDQKSPEHYDNIIVANRALQSTGSAQRTHFVNTLLGQQAKVQFGRTWPGRRSPRWTV